MTNRSPLACLLAAIGAATLFTACSGGGVTTTSVPATAVPTPVPTTGAASVTFIPSTTTSTTVALPGLTDAGVASQSITIPPVVGTASRVTVSITTTPPAGSPTFAGLVRRPLDMPTFNIFPLEYLTLSSTALLTFSNPPTFSAIFQLPNGNLLQTALLNQAATPPAWEPANAPCIFNSCALTGYPDPAGATTAVINLQPTPTTILVYTQSGSTPTPSPIASATASPNATASPTVTPSPSATPTLNPLALNVTPPTLSFSLGANGASAQTFTASESGFNGTFTTTNTCSSYATVSGIGPTFSVAPTATPVVSSTSATCTVTASDGHGQTATVSIYISSLGVNVSARGRNL